MAGTGERFSPRRLSERADDGFVRLGRSLGAAARYVESGVAQGVSRIPGVARAAVGKLKRPEPEDGDPGLAAAPATGPPAAATEEGEPAAPAAAPTPRRRPTGLKPGLAPPPPMPAAGAGPPDPALRSAPPCGVDPQQWLQQIEASDPVKATRLRGVLDDLLCGSADARREALLELASLGMEAEPVFLACLRGAGKELADPALEGLASIGSAHFLNCLWDLSAASDPEVRAVALRVAHRLRDELARPVLVRAARDFSPLVRRRALLWLSCRNAPWAVETIWSLCDDPEPSVRWAAIEALIPYEPAVVLRRVQRADPSDAPYARRASALLARATASVPAATTPAGEPADDGTPAAPVPPAIGGETTKGD
ncbi:MAG: HEAT repeat domain-containing protein [Deltaproteobacteria bacterium]|nr:HEAT repeat domain-containing protein [Deltaproteobacteria bacterium]